MYNIYMRHVYGRKLIFHLFQNLQLKKSDDGVFFWN